MDGKRAKFNEHWGTDIESPDFNVIYLRLATNRWLSGKRHTVGASPLLSRAICVEYLERLFFDGFASVCAFPSAL